MNHHLDYYIHLSGMAMRELTNTVNQYPEVLRNATVEMGANRNYITICAYWTEGVDTFADSLIHHTPQHAMLFVMPLMVRCADVIELRAALTLLKEKVTMATKLMEIQSESETECECECECK